jgi:MarR family 2-MHQ and catechol resistance regulon transcriptional repressor
MVLFRGSDDERAALGAFVRLLRAAETVSGKVHKRLQENNLTVSQFGVLEALYHVGPMCQRDLAQKILRTTGNLTLVIRNLEKRRLILRERDREDRRYFLVRLTKDGEQLVKEYFPGHAAEVTRVMEVLSPQEKRELVRICKKIGM